MDPVQDPVADDDDGLQPVEPAPPPASSPHRNRGFNRGIRKAAHVLSEEIDFVTLQIDECQRCRRKAEGKKKIRWLKRQIRRLKFARSAMFDVLDTVRNLMRTEEPAQGKK